MTQPGLCVILIHLDGGETIQIMSLRILSPLILLAAVLFGCADHTNDGIHATGSLIVNGLGWNGNVQVGSERIFTLKNIIEGNNYTVRTRIATAGTLTGTIYATEQDALDGGPVFASLVSHPTYSYLYEVNFTAPSSGDYYIALSGVPNTPIEFQYFYDLRLLSSSATTSFATAPTTTTIGGNTATLTAGYAHVYSGATLTSAGTYTVSVSSNATTTFENPQLYVYADSSLTTDSLLYSSYATTVDYQITKFALNTYTTVSSPVNEMPEIAFSATGPYILIKANSTTEYTLTVH